MERERLQQIGSRDADLEDGDRDLVLEHLRGAAARDHGVEVRAEDAQGGLEPLVQVALVHRQLDLGEVARRRQRDLGELGIGRDEKNTVQGHEYRPNLKQFSPAKRFKL